MTKTELAKCLELGGSFTFEVDYTPYPEVLNLVTSVAKSKGVLTLTKTKRLRPAEIQCLCDTAPGQVVFPDIEVR